MSGCAMVGIPVQENKDGGSLEEGIVRIKLNG